MLSHNTADKSCSCWILSFHSPSVILEWERSASPEGAHWHRLSLLLSTPNTQRDHTAVLNTAGPWKHQQQASNQLPAARQQQETWKLNTLMSTPWCLLETGWSFSLCGSHFSQGLGSAATLLLQMAARAWESSSHHTNWSSSDGCKGTSLGKNKLKSMSDL